MSESQYPPSFDRNPSDDFEPPPETDLAPALERLGPSPFPRSGFPLLGFLATVYDHVAEYAKKRREDAR